MVATGVTRPPTPTARKVTRGSRSFSSPSERNAGLESQAGRPGRQQDFQRRRLAEGPPDDERPVVDAHQASGAVPGWTVSRASAIASLPTSVSSTSVSGRKTRCCRGSSTVPEAGRRAPAP